MSSFLPALKCALVCFALAFFALTGNAQTQTDCSDTGTTGVPEAECQALVDLYNQTGGPSWNNSDNWNTTQPISTWGGVTVVNGHVTGLSLDLNELSGKIPDLSDLTSLVNLHLNQNKLSGTIPTELENLTALTSLYLWGNELSGEIPDLSNLTSLVNLYLHDNDLEGIVPAELNSLAVDNNSSLLQFSLWGNDRLNWTGISDELRKRVERAALSSFHSSTNGANWTNEDGWNSSFTFSDWHGVETDGDDRVTKLSLVNNNLTGEISDSLRGLTRLRLLELSRNKLSGAIPPRLGNLTSLEQLHLYENQLSGAIPPELGNLTDLLFLYLSDNQLSDAIPPELGNLTGLLVLDLSGNELSCDIPDLSPLSQLSQLGLQNNYQLGGTLSESLADSLQLLNISCTSIPPGDWPDRIPDFVVDPAPEDCMGTVEAACPSPAVSPVDRFRRPGSRSRRPGSRSRRPGSRSRRSGSRSRRPGSRSRRPGSRSRRPGSRSRRPGRG